MSCLRWALAVLVCLLLLCTFIWELHIELQVYPRSWIASEIQPVKPLAGCFERSRLSKEYNVTAAFAPKRFEIHSGTPMRLGMDCYDFASTIQARSPRPGLGHEAIGIPEWDAENWNYPGGGRIYFHTYWRVDLVPFEERQESLIKSFLATQNLNRTTMILWTNGDGKLRANPHVARWLKAFPEAFEVRLINLNALAKGTELEGSHLLNSQDARAWIDGDLLRLLVTWAFGGVWIDMDSLLIRDMSPLLEHEFVTQWDCYDKIYRPFNGAVMHFFKHSPYLCEAFHIMHRGPAPRSGSTDWGSLLYHKVFRSLMAAGIPPFKVCPLLPLAWLVLTCHRLDLAVLSHRRS